MRQKTFGATYSEYCMLPPLKSRKKREKQFGEDLPVNIYRVAIVNGAAETLSENLAQQ